MTKKLFALCLLPALFSFQIAEKKLTIVLTVQQAQIVLQGLSECDCPQKSTAEIKGIIVNEYNRQFPAPVKVDSSKTKKP